IYETNILEGMDPNNKNYNVEMSNFASQTYFSFTNKQGKASGLNLNARLASTFVFPRDNNFKFTQKDKNGNDVDPIGDVGGNFSRRNGLNEQKGVSKWILSPKVNEYISTEEFKRFITGPVNPAAPEGSAA